MDIKINSWNETDPLRALLVGDPSLSCNMPDEFPCRVRSYNSCKNLNGKMNQQEIDTAKKCLDNLICLLQNEYSVNIIRPEQYDHNKEIHGPNWSLPNTNEHSCPRDTFSILGNTILEAPMSWRCRYFESQVYHEPLLKIWSTNTQSRWIQPPKPLMNDNLYNLDYPVIDLSERYNFSEKYQYMLNDKAEPVFDAADILRCGKDLFVQKGFTTNGNGIEWLKREFGNEFRIHETLFKNNISPTHIDAELTILRPGLMMICPDRPIENNLMDLIKNEENEWDIVEAPYPVNDVMPDGCFSSKWLSMNILSIDENTVIVEQNETPLIKMLTEELGFNVIPISFYDAYKFGGGFHCQTLDIHRDGSQKSHFPYFDHLEEKHNLVENN